MLRSFLSAVFTIIVGTFSYAEAPAPVKLVSPQSVTLEAGKNQGAAVLVLQNDSDQDVKVSLTGKAQAANATLVLKFSDEKDTGPGNDAFDITVPKKGNARARLVFSNADQSADTKLDILDKGTSTKLGTLTLARPSGSGASASFSGKVNGTDKPALTLVRCQRTRIVLTGDNQPHTLDWELDSPTLQLCSGQGVFIPAGGKAFLDCVPKWSSASGHLANLLKADSSRSGYKLVLYDKSGQSAAQGASKPILAIYDTDATLDYVNQTWRGNFRNIIVFFVLVLGGICSLFLNFSLPNRLLRLNARERLRALARKTADLSSRVDSKLSVLLRLERSGLEDLLKSRWTLSPDFAGIAKQVADGTSKLETRVDLVQQMDVVMESIEKILPLGVPPSLLDDLGSSLQKATVLLGKMEPSDADVALAQALIGDVCARADKLTQPPSEFGQKVAAAIQAFSSTLQRISTTATFGRVNQHVPWPAAQIRNVQPTDQTVPPGTEADFDMALQQIRLIAQYVDLMEGSTAGIQGRLSQNESRLIDLLLRKNWQALGSARLLLREMKDNIYPQDLINALNASPQEASIEMNPSIAYLRSPLEFSVRFHSALLASSAAREEWICNWDFGDDLQERGWTVFHYFLPAKRPKPDKEKQSTTSGAGLGDGPPGMFEVRASFVDASGKPVPNSQNNGAVVLAKALHARQSVLEKGFGERTRIELTKLAATLLIAVFGLLAGGQTQLEKLDVLPGMIAVFLLGFGADSIKNILSSK